MVIRLKNIADTADEHSAKPLRTPMLNGFKVLINTNVVFNNYNIKLIIYLFY